MQKKIEKKKWVSHLISPLVTMWSIRVSTWLFQQKETKFKRHILLAGNNIQHKGIWEKKLFEDLKLKISLPQLRFFILGRKLLLLQNIVQRSSESRSTNASDKGFAKRPE